MKDRHLAILSLINERGQVSVQELSQMVGASMVTVRKDLEELEEKGLLIRQHGSAVKIPTNAINSRMTDHYQEKKRIARKAVSLIGQSETIMVESGSTCALFAQEIPASYDVTIITNSAYIAHSLSSVHNTKIVLLGGDYDTYAEVTSGPVTQLCAGEYYVDKFFVGVEGFTEGAGFTNENHTRCATIRALAQRANKTIVLTSSEKFGRRSVAKMFSAEEVCTVVTDEGISREHRDALEKSNVNVLIAD